MTQQIPSTEPELAGVRNFRDVGGLPASDGRRVRYGVLFRSGHLAHATEEDAAFLTSWACTRSSTSAMRRTRSWRAPTSSCRAYGT